MTRHGRRKGNDMDHVAPGRSPLNRYGSAWQDDAGDVRSCIEAVMNHHQARPRKNAPVGSHILLTASPGYFRPDDPDAMGTWAPERLETWLAANLDWIDKRWPHQVAAWRLDLDEATPHLDVFLVPIHRWRTRSGRTITQVSHRAAFGASRRSFGLLQNDYAAAMQPLGLARGRPRSVTGAVHVHPAELRRRMARDARWQKAIRLGLAGLLRQHIFDLAIDGAGHLTAQFSPAVPHGARHRFMDLIQPAAIELVDFEMQVGKESKSLAQSIAERLIVDTHADRQEAADRLIEADILMNEMGRLSMSVPAGPQARVRELMQELVR
jgi:hypothetical protein